jgi:hypothetical protein
MKVDIISVRRTPSGALKRGLTSFIAPQLGSIVIKFVLEDYLIDPAYIVVRRKIIENVFNFRASTSSWKAGSPIFRS